MSELNVGNVQVKDLKNSNETQLINVNETTGALTFTNEPEGIQKSLDSWDVAGRPSSPVIGQSGFNTELGYLETYNGYFWHDSTQNGIVRGGLILELDPTNPESHPGSGKTICDLSQRGNQGTVLDGVSYSGDDDLRYMRFTVNGSNQRIDVPHREEFNYDYRNWAYSFWIKTNFDDNGSWAQLFIKGNDGGNRRPGVWYYSGSTSRLHITWRHSSQTQQTLNTSDPFVTPTGVWNHYVIQARNGTMMSFKDGVQDSQTLSISDRSFNSDPLHIGNWNYRAPGFDMGHWAVYSRSLSDAEVIQNYQALRGRFGV